MINMVALIGRLVADPELKHTQSNIAVTSFTLAVDRTYVKPGEERTADFIDITAWRNTAEFICKYFTKGQLIAVEGSIQTRTYTDKNENKRKAVEVVAKSVSFCGAKQDELKKMKNTAEKQGYNTDPQPGYQNIPTDDDLPF